MNNQPNYNGVTDELLAKYFAGEANPQEAMEVDDWAAATEENASAFRRLFHTLHHASPGLWRKPNTDIAWEEVKVQLPAVKNTRVVLPGWWMAAAVLLITAVAGWLYLRKPEPQPMNMAVAGPQEVKEMTLADGSIVTLNAGSRLDWPAAFAADSRKVIVTGEAYFEVAVNANAPFEVEGKEVNIRVLGTSFNTSATDTSAVAEVYTGKILLYNNYGKLVVSAGQTGLYHKPTHSFRLLQQINKKSNAYATMRFDFENDSLPVICETLSKAYHKTITFRGQGLAALKMSSVFEKQSLDYILEVIAATLNIQYTYAGNNEIVFTQE
jgi:ferric-dicitrate binding protein FerR (iron transport regulator)